MLTSSRRISGKYGGCNIREKSDIPPMRARVIMRKYGPAGVIVIGKNSWRDAVIARWGMAWSSPLDSECVFKYGIEEN